MSLAPHWPPLATHGAWGYEKRLQASLEDQGGSQGQAGLLCPARVPSVPPQLCSVPCCACPSGLGLWGWTLLTKRTQHLRRTDVPWGANTACDVILFPPLMMLREASCVPPRLSDQKAGHKVQPRITGMLSPALLPPPPGGVLHVLCLFPQPCCA